MVKLFLFCFGVLPSLTSAIIICPDGTPCPHDKKCCSLSERTFKCCDSNDNDDLKLVEFGVDNVKELRNISHLDGVFKQSAGMCKEGVTCTGKCCSTDQCCPTGAICCDISGCCPEEYPECCLENYCCKKGQQCIGNRKCKNTAPFFVPSFIILTLLFLTSRVSWRFMF